MSSQRKIAELRREEILRNAPGGFFPSTGRFLTTAISSLFDPLALLGYVIAGALITRLWATLLVAVVWAVALEWLSSVLASSLQLNAAFGNLLLPRIAGGVLCTGVVFAISATARGARRKQPGAALDDDGTQKLEAPAFPEACKKDIEIVMSGLPREPQDARLPSMASFKIPNVEPTGPLPGSMMARSKEDELGTTAPWLRIATIACVVWFGGVVMLSAVSRDFVWFRGYGGHDLGPATIVAVVGIVLIFVVCLGVPWIAEARNNSNRFLSRPSQPKRPQG